MIYLASSYTHSDPAVRQERFRAAGRAADEKRIFQLPRPACCDELLPPTNLQRPCRTNHVFSA